MTDFSWQYSKSLVNNHCYFVYTVYYSVINHKCGKLYISWLWEKERNPEIKKQGNF